MHEGCSGIFENGNADSRQGKDDGICGTDDADAF